MSDKWSVGSKRLKLSHQSPNTTTTSFTSSAGENPLINSAVNSRVSKDAHKSQLWPTPTPSVGFSSNHGGWIKLRRLTVLLNQSAKSFGPLKSAVDVFSKSIDIFENGLKHNEEYQLLKVELESLFSDLSGYLAGPSPPMITRIIAKIAGTIENEIELITRMQEQSKALGFLEAEKNSDEVLGCYRRTQSLLKRLTLNLDMGIIELLGEQSTDSRLGKLPSSPGAAYMSSHSDNLGRGECTPNTRARVLQELHDWAYNPQAPRICWLNGMAGAGKTTITFSICTQLDRTRKLAASFFCSRQLPECRDTNKIIPSIAYQLSIFSCSFRRALSELLKEDPEAHNRPLAVQFEQLIVEPLMGAAEEFPTDRVVVIDALDECDDASNISRLISVILENAHTLPLKFFLTSRPEPGVLDHVHGVGKGCVRAELRLHDLEETIVQEDIRTYLSYELRTMNLTSAQLEELVKRSGVLFIYAATVVRYLNSNNFSSSAERLDEVLNISMTSSVDINREIDALYTTILRTAFCDPTFNMLDRTRMELLLRTVVCAQEPLSMDAMAGLIGLDVDRVVRPRLRPFMSILHVSEDKGVVTTLHESFSDYLLNPGRSGEFYCDPRTYHTEMAYMCFEAIGQPNPPFNICDLGSSYLFDEQVIELKKTVELSIPAALSYACRYWGAHTTYAQPSPELAHCLEQFLRTRLLLWIEVLNLKNCVADGARTLYAATQIALYSNEARELIQDALEFITVLSSGEVLRSTAHIYLSGLAFWPKQQPIWKHYSQYLAGLVETQGTTLKMKGSTLLAKIEAESNASYISYSPDGLNIISGHSDGTLCLWNAHTSRQVGDPLNGHTQPVNSVAYSPNGLCIASSSDDATISIWDARTGLQMGRSLTGHTDGVLSLAYSLDGTRIISGSWDQTIRIWCTLTGQQLGPPLRGHTGSIQTISFSPNGRYIASGSSDKTICIWDVVTGLQIGLPLNGHTHWVRSVDYSPDGSRIVSGSWDETIRVWDVYTGQQVGYAIQGHGGVDAVAYSPDGKSIIAGMEYGDIYVWDAYTGQRIGRLREREAYSPIRSVAFSLDGSRIISSSEEGSGICIWNAQSYHHATATQEEHVTSVSAIAYSPNGTCIFSCSDEDTTICLWDTQTGQMIGQPLEGHTQVVLSIACSPDGAYIFSGSVDCTIRIWDATTGQQVGQPLEGHKESILSVTCSPDAACIASGSSDKTICRWSIHEGRQIGRPLKGHRSFVRTITYSPDGAYIVSGSGDNTLRIWEAKTGNPIGEPFIGHTDHIYSVSCSPDSTRIVSGSGDKTIRIWDAFTGQQIGLALEGHNGDVYSAVYSPNGLSIISASLDNTMRVWDVHTGKQVGEALEGHTDSIRSLAFSPCGLYVASGSNDGNIRIWRACQIQDRSSSHEKKFTPDSPPAQAGSQEP